MRLRSATFIKLLTPNSSLNSTPNYHELHDSDVATLIRLLLEETQLTITSNDVYTVQQSDTCSLPYNPFFAYLQPLQGQWKPGDKDYLHELIQTVEVEGGEETRALLDDFFKRWMVGMVHGWIHLSSTHGTILTFTVRRFNVNPFSYRLDYEHIYAQALYLAQHEAEMFVMSQKDIRQLDQHNEQYVSQSVEVELCSVYVHHPNLGDNGQPLSDSKWMKAAEILSRLNYYNPSAKLSIRGIAIA